MNLKTIRVSDVMRRFADMLDNPTHWGKVRDRDPQFQQLGNLLRQLRLFARVNMDVDLMPGAVLEKGGEPLVTNQPNRFELPFKHNKELQ